MSTETYSSRWEATLQGATSPLLEFLQRMGAQQLCVRVVALMAIPPPTAVDVLNMSFAGLANKVAFRFRHISFLFRPSNGRSILFHAGNFENDDEDIQNIHVYTHFSVRCGVGGGEGGGSPSTFKRYPNRYIPRQKSSG